MFSNQNVKVGDIFVSSWGYEQTNVDFYQVIQLCGKSSIYLKEIGSKVVNRERDMSGERQPVPNLFLNETIIKKRVRNDSFGKISFKVNDYATARITTPDQKHYFSSYY